MKLKISSTNNSGKMFISFIRLSLFKDGREAACSLEKFFSEVKQSTEKRKSFKKKEQFASKQSRGMSAAAAVRKEKSPQANSSIRKKKFDMLIADCGQSERERAAAEKNH